MIKLGDLFEIEYGSRFDFNKMIISENKEDNYINYVSRTSKNNGIVTRVAKYQDIEPLPAGLISVSLGGTYLLSSFIQPEPFYTAQNVAILKEKISLNEIEKLYYCTCIAMNRFRYGAFGREANRTIREILVPHPDNIPQWVYEANIPDYSNIPLPYLEEKTPELKMEEWKEFRLDELFDIEVGKGPTSKFANKNAGNIPFISATANDNGVTTFTSYEATHKENTITVSRNGSIGESFYQPTPFCATADVAVLNPKFENNQYISIFIAIILKREKYKYNYGRKWNSERMNNTIVKLPSTKEGNPDWKWMENYIKTLKFSSKLKVS